MKYPRQFPVPTAWLKSFVLSGFVFGVFAADETEASNSDAIWVENWMNNNPEVAIFTGILLVLSPIALIAIFHYFGHLLAGMFSSKLQCERVQKQPVLMSLWEGVYGWLVILVATLVMIALWTSSVSGFTTATSVPIALRLTWLATAAYLYHLEYSTRQK